MWHRPRAGTGWLDGGHLPAGDNRRPHPGRSGKAFAGRCADSRLRMLSVVPLPDLTLQFIPIPASHGLGGAALERLAELSLDGLLGRLPLLDLANDRAEILAGRAE